MYVGTVKRPCVSVHGDGYTRTVPVSHIRGRFPTHHSKLWSPVSLRLGHATALTCHRQVIHYRGAASLPQGGELLDGTEVGGTLGIGEAEAGGEVIDDGGGVIIEEEGFELIHVGLPLGHGGGDAGTVTLDLGR